MGVRIVYKVVVAEDSKPIVRDIVSKLKAFDPEIDVEIAYDGEKALELVRKNKPDIMFTDIKMPLMDGLTLIQKAKGIYPSLKCVIISGYGDFEYTHKALKLQVDEYILKPVDAKDFKKIMIKIVSEIKQNEIRKKESAVSDVLNGRISHSHDLSSIKGYMLSIVRNGVIPKLSEPVAKSDIYASLGIKDPEGSILVADTKFACEKLILYDLDKQPEEKIIEYNESVFSKLSGKYLQLNMICSEKLSEIDRLYDQYMDLSNSLSSMILLDKSKIYTSTSDFVDNNLINLNTETKKLRKKIECIIRNGHPSSLFEEIRREICVWQQNNYPVIFIKRLLMIILDEIINYFESDCMLPFDLDYQIDKILNDCKNYGDLEERLNNYLNAIIDTKGTKSGSSMEAAEKIEKYLRNNLYGNITMQDLSDKFRLSPSYINRLMRMYYGVSPMEYYNSLKMEEAKKLLMENREMLVKDVAEILGFTDQHYFSKVFKMQFGISPVNYRNNLIFT
jgi:YesN/AraC family two-component response regulator